MTDMRPSANIIVGQSQPTQTFVLPFPVSVNNMFLNIPGRGRIKSPKYRAWQTEAGWRLRQQRAIPISGHVEVSIVAIRPDNRRRDIDNLSKAVCDILVVNNVITDDKMIVRLTAEWSQSSDLSGVSVTVAPKPTMGES